MGVDFVTVTRETGFLYALMSSSVAHTIYRACLNGEIRCCTCSSPYVDHQRGRNKTLFWTTCACAIRTIMKTVIKQLGLVVSGKPRTLPAVSFAYRHNAIVGLEVSSSLIFYLLLVRVSIVIVEKFLEKKVSAWNTRLVYKIILKPCVHQHCSFLTTLLA